MPERAATQLGDPRHRDRARSFASGIHISTVPVWRRRGGQWHSLVHVHIIAPTKADCEEVFVEMMDALLLEGHLRFEAVPRPSAVEVRPAAVEVRPDTIEVRPDALVEFDFSPHTAGVSSGYDRGDAVELVAAGPGDRDIVHDVGPGGDDSALMHAQRVGNRDVFEFLDPYMYSKWRSGYGSWVAVFFTKYKILGGQTPSGGGQAPPVVHRCNAHISICKGTISKERLTEGVDRAKQVVEKLMKKGRHFQGQAFFDMGIEGNGHEHYSWSDILVSSPLHPTCFAIMHAISPQMPRRNFHVSFDTWPRDTPAAHEVRPIDEVRPIAPAEPGRSGSSTDRHA